MITWTPCEPPAALGQRFTLTAEVHGMRLYRSRCVVGLTVDGFTLKGTHRRPDHAAEVMATDPAIRAQAGLAPLAKEAP